MAHTIRYRDALAGLMLALAAASCGEDSPQAPATPPDPDKPYDNYVTDHTYSPDATHPTEGTNRMLILCEGLWGMDDSCITYWDRDTVVNYWFQAHNPKQKLGDTANDILMVNDTLIAISVNTSNIIQYIHPDGTAIAATEGVPNNRKLATDGHYLYCTSYADHGYVAKIDLLTKQVVDTCHVGREPEGIACWEGRLYVANTGGYSSQEGDHDYESTLSVVDAASMKELRRIETGSINLFGKMSQNKQFLCINSGGDYYEVEARSLVFDMRTETLRTFDFPATYNCTYGNKFYAIGSRYSFITQKYEYSMHTIELPSLDVTEGLGDYACAEEAVCGMQSPYGLYISPYSGHMYVADARSNATNGQVFEFAPAQSPTLVHKAYIKGINPGHFLALPHTEGAEAARRP